MSLESFQEDLSPQEIPQEEMLEQASTEGSFENYEQLGTTVEQLREHTKATLDQIYQMQGDGEALVIEGVTYESAASAVEAILENEQVSLHESVQQTLGVGLTSSESDGILAAMTPCEGISSESVIRDIVETARTQDVELSPGQMLGMIAEHATDAEDIEGHQSIPTQGMQRPYSAAEEYVLTCADAVDPVFDAEGSLTQTLQEAMKISDKPLPTRTLEAISRTYMEKLSTIAEDESVARPLTTDEVHLIVESHLDQDFIIED
jgi:hypothetical protein